MPTLLNRMSSRPYWSTAVRKILDLLFVRYVDTDGDGAARRFDLAHRLFGVVEIDVGHDNPRTLLRESQRGASGRRRSRTGDDGALAVQYTVICTRHSPETGQLSQRKPVQPFSMPAQQLVLNLLGSPMVLRATVMQCQATSNPNADSRSRT